ncbi:hypothetical protein Q7P37_003680 [Cladosporium fusiforme]
MKALAKGKYLKAKVCSRLRVVILEMQLGRVQNVRRNGEGCPGSNGRSSRQEAGSGCYEKGRRLGDHAGTGSQRTRAGKQAEQSRAVGQQEDKTDAGADGALGAGDAVDMEEGTRECQQSNGWGGAEGVVQEVSRAGASAQTALSFAP